MEETVKPIDIIFDMETSDPDDVCTLCFLCQTSMAKLRAITVTPGTRTQIWTVREFLKRCGDPTIPIGARKPDHNKECVSQFLSNYLGDLQSSEPDGLAPHVLENAFKRFPDATLLTGAPLGNAGMLLKWNDQKYKRWVVQGGFAGDSVVAPEDRLRKFAGLETCPTFNFNGDRPSAKSVIGSDRIGRKVFVSKNVCHGVVYGRQIHEQMKTRGNKHPAWQTLMSMMDAYLEKRPEGKMFHDPLAAAVAINEEVCKLREVEIYTEKGEWGSRLKDGTNCFISVAVNKGMFWSVFAG